MKETVQHIQDKVAIVSQKEVAKKQVLLGKLRPQKGQTCYELNLETGDFTEAQIEKKAVIKKNGEVHINSKIVAKPLHLYCLAINKPNAERKFRKMLEAFR